MFSDYDGKEEDVHDGVEYFKKKFIEKNEHPDTRTIYLHVTCATDTQNVHVVFEACKDIVLYENVKEEWTY